MDKIVITFHGYVINFIDRMNLFGIRSFSCIEYIISIVITCLINYFYWISIIWYPFTYIVFINCFIINTNTWLCISLFLQSNERIKWTFGMNADTRKVLIPYNIITIWCIQIIWFTTVDVWVNSNTYPLPRLVWNLPPLFIYWQRKHHFYLFYFCKIVSQYNQN